jgi:hypothetical protein
MDVIALVEAGFEAAVAPLGTAVTEDQLRLMWRVHPEPIVALDGDTAGLRAAMRLIDLALPLIEAGQSLRFAIMPEGLDPDDLIKAQGKGAMQKLLEGALPMVDAPVAARDRGQGVRQPGTARGARPRPARGDRADPRSVDSPPLRERDEPRRGARCSRGPAPRAGRLLRGHRRPFRAPPAGPLAGNQVACWPRAGGRGRGGAARGGDPGHADHPSGADRPVRGAFERLEMATRSPRLQRLLLTHADAHEAGTRDGGDRPIAAEAGSDPLLEKLFSAGPI